MFELIALLLECRSSGTLPDSLAMRVDVVVRDALKGFDALQAYQLEQDFLEDRA